MAPPPILSARPGQRALIVGQAPGITEPTRGVPFAGAAGRRLIDWLAPLRIASHADFLDRFAIAAVAKCYPGRHPGGRGDRPPSRDERAHCRPWTDALVRLLEPRVVIPIGRLAIDDWLSPLPLAECVGQQFEIDGRIVVPLPHPSGVSAWTNSDAHRVLVRRAVLLIGDALRDSDEQSGTESARR